jgi:hypothetical protein
MPSGSQPAVEGTGSGLPGPRPVPPPPAGAATGGGPARTADPRRGGAPGPPGSSGSSGSSGNGAAKGRTRGAPPAHAATARQPVVAPGPGRSPRPVGRADARGRSDNGRGGPRGRKAERADAGTRVVAARRTRRVVRKIDVWTVLKMSLLFYLCVFLVLMVAGVVLWNVAQAFNVIHSVEKFIRSIFDLQKFTFRPMVVLQSSFVGGLVLVLLGTGTNVLSALLYNLISDVVGGVQFIVLEEMAPPE